jgi:PAS domain-containing protein
LTFSNDVRDFDRNLAQLDHLMAGQLSYCRRGRGEWNPPTQRPAEDYQHPPPPLPTGTKSRIDTKRLPLTWPEALTYRTSRAIVITETTRPFPIVHVNAAWENLCGYTQQEAHGRSLGSLLHGKDTEIANITAMLHPLLVSFHNNHNRDEAILETGTVITNFTKTGRRFRNRVRIGPLYQEMEAGAAAAETNCATHFVGVLQEIDDGM